jgi:hypothetical protein
MKKYLLAAAALFVFGVSVANAQTATPAATTSPTPTPVEVFDFAKAYKDYVFMSDQYNKAHADYLLARAQYFQAETLASKTKARDATALMLRSRDNVMSSYLTALRLRLSEGEGVDETTKNGLFSRLDADIAWWRNHHDRINSAGTLEDLVVESDLALKHFPISEALSYEFLATIPGGKEFVLRNTLNELLSKTKTKVSQIRSNGDHNTTNAERWIIETEQKLTRSLDKEIAVQKLIVSLATVDPKNKTSKSGTYNQAILGLDESLQFLKEASGYLKEVIKQIKIKQ